MKRAAIMLGLLALCGVSLYLRLITFPAVFQSGFVNFLQTDSWYHVRSIDHLVRNFPWRMSFDPYSSLAHTHELATGPFFDFVIAFAAWIAGFGHPSEYTVHAMAAWYPAALGVLIVPAVFMLARKIFGTRAGLIAAAVVATLPGHFLRVGVIGYTDHHVMESLLSTVFFWLLLRAIERPGRRTLAAGLALGAYLLTFVGGAFLVAVVLLWMIFEQMRSRWPRKKSAPDAKILVGIFSIALVIVAPWYRTLWMGYTIAALAGGAAAIVVIQWWSLRAKSQVLFFGGLVVTILAVAGIAAALSPDLFHILVRLAPSFADRSAGIAELQSLLTQNSAFSLRPVWNEFAGAIMLALAGILLLAEMAVRSPEPRRNLIFFWSAVTMLLAAGQLRMTYYFAIGVAILSGYVIDRLLAKSSPIRWAAAAAMLLLVFVPNLLHATDLIVSGVEPDWRAALQWLRYNTPEPFGDPDFYYAPYRAPAPEPAYSVMSWWDYGYWIMALGRRVPVTNPTQVNASAAAEFLLAQNEPEAAAVLEKWRTRYVIVDHALPMLSTGDRSFGKFASIFFYNRDVSLDDYIVSVQQRDSNGTMLNRVLYRPAYFRSMLVRLFIFGGEAVEKPSGIALAFVRDNGKSRELVDLREYPSEEAALAAEPACRYQGCFIASTNPFQSCIRLDALTRFHPAFASDTRILKNDNGSVRTAVQIYEFK